MKKVVALSFLCFLFLSSCIIQKRYHLKGFQIIKSKTGNKNKISDGKKKVKLNFVENSILNSKLDHSNKVNQESKNIITPNVSFEPQTELQEINPKTKVSFNKSITSDNQVQTENSFNQFGSAKIGRVSDHSQHHFTEFRQRSTSKSIHQNINKSAVMPLWKQAVIFMSALVVLIGLYIVLVFSGILAFGN